MWAQNFDLKFDILLTKLQFYSTLQCLDVSYSVSASKFNLTWVSLSPL